MSVRTTEEGVVALYDSTTGIAFGPVFSSAGDAAEFCDWFERTYELDLRYVPQMGRSWNSLYDEFCKSWETTKQAD